MIISDPMTVELVPHLGWDDKATIPGWVEHNQFLVYVHSEGLAHRNKDKKLQVGIIGKHDGANFCPTSEFNGFVHGQQLWIAEEAKRLHGSASTKQHSPLLTEPEEDDPDDTELEE
jgi:hypothetical protein